MKYALGNMLNGAGGLNADQLALDLQFAADKTLTARRGPTPILTRGSTGTFVGSNGLIQSAGNNVARFDHDPVTLASRGLLIEEGRTNLVFPSDTLTTQTRTVTAVAHTLSFYGTGTVVLSGAHSATVVGTGAYPSRQTLTFTPTAGSLTLTVTGTVQFAQLEAGSFPTSYIPTTTSALARSADVCSITGSAFSNLWNTSGGTFLFEGFLIPSTSINLRMLSSGGSRRWLYGNQPGVGTITETIALFDGSSTPPYFTNVRIAVKFKMAISVEALTCKASFNGSAISTVSHNGNLLTSVTLLGLFETASGFISGVKYYKKNLSNAKLQALTV